MIKLQGDIKALTLVGAFLEVMKEENPQLHEKITKKHRDMMNSIVPDSKTGPTISEFIKQILAKAE